MKTFEYIMVPQPRGATGDDPLELLNRYGAEGWELAGIDYGCFIFKKEVP